MASPADDIIALYERHAAAWNDARVGPLFERAWLDRFLSLVPAGGDVLDLGCGSGRPMAVALDAAGFRVTGVDSSPSLIRLCETRLPAHRWIVGDMRRLALGLRFDAILAWDSFFHLGHDDQRAMFEVFARHAAPGASLMFTSGPGHGEAIGIWQGEPLFHASLDSQEYRSLLDRHGFELVAHAVEDPGCGHHTIWLARSKDGACDAGPGPA